MIPTNIKHCTFFLVLFKREFHSVAYISIELECTSAWSDGLAAAGPSYYTGIVTNLEEILEAHKQQIKPNAVLEQGRRFTGSLM